MISVRPLDRKSTRRWSGIRGDVRIGLSSGVFSSLPVFSYLLLAAGSLKEMGKVNSLMIRNIEIVL
jgi:hypothetical protein